jgi:hypothetical protein
MTTAEKLAAINALLRDERCERFEDMNWLVITLIIDAPTAPEPVWWVVTLRVERDDEDSLYVVQADDPDAATAAARAVRGREKPRGAGQPDRLRKPRCALRRPAAGACEECARMTTTKTPPPRV